MRFLRRVRLSSRLILAFCLLILVTTLSAGVPAYWLIRQALEQQAQAHLQDARQATAALLQAEQERLADLATLLAERPTLQRLMQEPNRLELEQYLGVFQAGVELDGLLVCDVTQRPLTNDVFLPGCPSAAGDEVTLLAGQPAMVVTRQVMAGELGAGLGSVTAVLWLDAPFVQQLAAETGLVQSVVLPDGRRFVSSVATLTSITSLPPVANDKIHLSTITSGNGRYYTTWIPLTDQTGETAVWFEVALPIDDLFNAENRALLILAASTGLVVVVGSLVGGWYAYRLTHPLKQLTDVAQKISQGDLTTPVPVLPDPIEVTTLAATLEESRVNILHSLDELARARDWLNNLIQSVVEGVVTFDTYGRITFFSQGAELITGWSATEATNRPVNDIFRLVDEREGQFLDQIPPRGGKVQMTMMTRDGKTAVLSVSGSRLVPPHDHKVQIALVLRDVTEEEAGQRLRSYFLANISHEFRTPLTALKASMELLLNEAEGLTAVEMRELLKPSYLSLLTLQTLIDNLLESSSMEAGKFTIRRRITDFAQVTADAISLVLPLFQRRQQTLLLHQPDELPDISADPPRLLQVLVNLLSNASKYSPAASTIELTVTKTAENLHVAIADQGPGISAAEQDAIFRRFTRVGPQSGEQYGIGLGLYVSKVIVEGHGGCVGINGRATGGSIFWFELPAHSD